MTLAIIIVIAAFLSLVCILGLTISRSLQVSAGHDLAGKIHPLDVEAFRNLLSPSDDAFLRQHLSASDFRLVQRARLRAMAAYVQEAGRNAAVLIRIGQAAMAAADPFSFLLVFAAASGIEPAGNTLPIEFVSTSAIRRGTSSAVHSRFASSREISMNRTVSIPTMKGIRIALSCLLLAGFSLGQGGVATGDLHVSVKDPSGNAVVNATVTVRDLAKGLERVATSDGEGGYSVRLLPPGTYVVTVDVRGFAKAEAKEVSIPVGGLVELPVSLSVAGTTEIVEVTSQAELVETARSSTTDTIGQRRIDNLPINGRDYINFTLTDSQVVRDNAPNTGAAPTSGLNMSGQRGRSNLVNVDGADATDNSINGVRSTVSQEAVQEFQIITNGYASEYGRASGGVVNIITRSGSNTFHGDVFGYLRNRNFQAVNPFSTVKNPAYTRVQAGVAFGGPIRKDKTYYYFSYEVTRRHETGFSSIGQNNFGLIPFDTANTAGGIE